MKKKWVKRSGETICLNLDYNASDGYVDVGFYMAS